MRNTVNYGLNMPDLEDFYNVEDFNENAEIIDDAIHENELAINTLSEETQSALDGVSDKIGNTEDTGATDSTGTVMGKLNTTIKKIDSVISFNEYNHKTFTQDGEFIVPDGISIIYVTAAAGGGGGGGGKGGAVNRIGGGGGGGGACIARKLYPVEPGQVISITIGKGGIGGEGINQRSESSEPAYGENGTPTILSNIVTLSGGSAGRFSTGGNGGSPNGGEGANGRAVGSSTGQNAGDGIVDTILGINGIGGSSSYAGGGGGSIGYGGSGSAYSSGSSGMYGGGGSGGGASSTSDDPYTNGERGGKGGDGIVVIEWGNISIAPSIIF